MPETRRIENYGILKLLPYERGAINLIVLCDVVQLPFSEYSNLKSNPTKSHYGYVCFMSGEYVLDVKDIQFRRQVIVDRDRYLIQLAWQEYCNSKTIAHAVDAPLPDTEVDYPIWLCDELRFKLEPGVVINVFKSHVSPITCGSGGVIEPDYSPEAPGLPDAPQTPPAKNAPESAKLPLSSPYEGENDNGNTYVRDIPLPPPPPLTGGAGVYAVVTFSGTPSFGGPATQAFKVGGDPTKLSEYSTGGRCGDAWSQGGLRGIAMLQNGNQFGCAQDNTTRTENVYFIAKTD